MPWRRLVPPSRTSPYEVLLLALGVVLGTTQATGVSVSAALNDTLPEHVAQVWGAMLALGSAVAIVGISYSFRDVYTSHVMERIGTILVGVGAIIYALAVWSSDVHSYYSVGVNLGFGTASLWRAWQITDDFRRAKRMFRRSSA
jgi:hypothetical protein